MIDVGSDFSGVGAFNQALIRLGINYKTVFACDMDKYARQTYIANHGEPEYYPENVYDRIVPNKSLDIFMTSPPCQSFSIAGNRKGKDSDNGILFFNSHQFIKENKPRYFIFENVKGLLSDDKKNKTDEFGRTFSEWINLLGGKSVNGLPVLFPYDDSVPYHIYWKVLNSKKHGVPQNRERVFIVGIRDDKDNSFTWPKEEPLIKRLKDVLEDDVDDKYFLSEKMVKGLLKHSENHKDKGNGFGIQIDDGSGLSHTIPARYGKDGKEQLIKIIGNTNPSGNGINGNVFDSDGISPTLCTNKGEGIKVIQINPSKESGGVQPYKQNRVYETEGISPVLDTECGRPGILVGFKIRRLTPRECFRLQDFPDSFVMPCSDSQMYKQAGNSITVGVLAKIIERFGLSNK